MAGPEPPVDLARLTPEAAVRGEDDEDSRLLAEAGEQARRHLEGHPWCRGVEELWLGHGIGGVVSVFLARMTTEGYDPWVWVVVGDVPPLHLVCDELPDPLDALETYVDWRWAWVHAVRAGDPVDDLPPVNVPAEQTWADQLESRLEFLEEQVLPRLRADREGR